MSINKHIIDTIISLRFLIFKNDLRFEDDEDSRRQCILQYVNKYFCNIMYIDVSATCLTVQKEGEW